MFSRERKTPIAEWWWTIDKPLLAALVLLMMVGMVLSFAASPPVAERLGLGPWHFIVRHAMFMLPALAVMIAASLMTPRAVRVSAGIVLVVSLILLWLTLRFGVEVKGAKRWISAFGQTIQPSEFVKPAYAIIGAWLCAEGMKRKDVPAGVISFLIMLVIVAGLLLQPDLGQTALVLATWAGLMFLAGLSWFWIFGLLFVAAGMLFGAYAFFPHFARRIDAFLGIEEVNKHVDGYQARKALDALLEGGWFGRGPGESVAKKLIPDAHADYVFSAAAGEFGILFCLCLVGLIAFIVMRALMGAQRLPNLFSRLAASMLAIQFGLQCGINLAVNLNLMPPKGMTLPFVSYGGTSMIAVAFGMGLMLALTRKKPEERLATGLPPHRSPVLAPAE